MCPLVFYGGRTIAENCQMLCRDCNRRKSGK
ncbi:MAG: HNH endonuclease [Salinivirgaceae bacterium]|nr:HNH endonuclease [Salinivirgaceae bacterium]